MLLPHEMFESVVTALRVAPPGREGDRRVTRRTRVSAGLRVEPLGTDTGPPLDAWLSDLSRGGLGLIVPRPLASGLSLRAKLPAGSASQSVPVKCRVVHCRATANGMFVVGAEFVSRRSGAESDARSAD